MPPPTRCPICGLLTVFLGLLALGPTAASAAADQRPRPHVLVVITDDQGYGELSCHGNPVLRTPHLDRLAGESVRFTDFHVAPMCTPTRGQLLTGVDALRNGAMNVSSGRTLLRREFPTLAELFAASGWRSGLFGKWHLGDTYPYRPQDRGFHESLWFPSSHIGSVPDAWENDYFDDTYLHNGLPRACTGYTTDVFFCEAMQWMQAEAAAGRPFFCYLATAAPHQPHFVPDRYRAAVRAALQAAEPDLPLLAQLPPDRRTELVSYLAMIANIDENMGRLDEWLARTGLRDDTLLVFLTDNGSTFGPRYFPAGMKGGKATLWEGGHRVPCLVRWPGGALREPGPVAGLTQVQDLLPTLAELCGLQLPGDMPCDGISLADVLRARADVSDDRHLVINFSRMPFASVRFQPDSAAVPRRDGAAVLWKRWRLLQDRELYHLDDDPLQEHNVIDRYPEVAATMRAHLDRWWAGVQPRVNEFQPSVVGHETANPQRLTACEWADVFLDQQAQVRRGERKTSFWHLDIAADGEYAWTVSRWPPESGLRIADGIEPTRAADGTLTGGPAWPVASAYLQVAGIEQAAPVTPEATCVRFVTKLPAGRTTLQAELRDASGAEIGGAYYVTAQRLPDDQAAPVKLILDTDMSGDADDAGALALLHALADLGQCELLATVVNRKDLTNASAAAVDAVNTWYGRPDLPIGTDKVGPTALQRTSLYAPGLRDGFPHDSGPDDQAPDALEVYRQVLAAQPDGGVTICSVGALSNLAELLRREPDLVRAKVRRLVVMGGQFPPRDRPETNIGTHVEAARYVAAEWPTEIVWQGFEVGHDVLTGAGLQQTPAANPVRRAYELRRYAGRPSIQGGQPSYDQAAALYAVGGPDPELWRRAAGGRVEIDEQGLTRWRAEASGRHVVVSRACPPARLAERIETLMVRPPARTADAAGRAPPADGLDENR